MDWTLPEDERLRVNALAKYDFIQEADRHLAAMKARASQAASDLGTADAALAAATQVSKQAVAGQGDPMAAERALEEATRVRHVAQKVFDAATSAIDSALEAFHQARNQAWQPVYLAGIQRRIEAAQKADRARAMLEEAQRDHHTGTSIMQLAFTNGVPHPATSGSWNHPVSTEKGELQIWGLGKNGTGTGWLLPSAFECKPENEKEQAA